METAVTETPPCRGKRCTSVARFTCGPLEMSIKLSHWVIYGGVDHRFSRRHHLEFCIGHEVMLRNPVQMSSLGSQYGQTTLFVQKQLKTWCQRYFTLTFLCTNIIGYRINAMRIVLKDDSWVIPFYVSWYLWGNTASSFQNSISVFYHRDLFGPAVTHGQLYGKTHHHTLHASPWEHI